MLKIGCWILTLWSALNLAASLKIVVDTLFRGGHTPALYLLLSESDVQALATDTLSTLDSIAVFANGLNVAFCALALCLIWRGLGRHKSWSFAALLLGFSAAWLAGVAADFVVGTAAPWVNVASFAILFIGFALSGAELYWKRPQAHRYVSR
ncbi:MAG: hypothetical protein AAF560_07340 [Acidobacteriota bacterium]